METKDNLIDEKIVAIDSKIKAIDSDENYSNPKYKTNCYPSLMDGKKVNFKTIVSVNKLMEIYEYLFSIKELKDKASSIFKENNLDIPEDYYNRDGFPIDNYLSDILLRIKQLNLIQVRGKLVVGKSKLEDLYSQSKKDDLKFNNLMDDINKLI